MGNIISIPEETMVSCKNHRLSDDVIQQYANGLKRHINFVMEAFIDKLGLDYGEIEYHDLSKWYPEEFPFYAKHFFGGGDPNGFAHGWLHHLHNNPHHWQYWMFPDNFTPKDSNVVNGCIEMPTCFINEMVADWMGASKAYTGDWNMSDWLSKNFYKVRLHPKSMYHVKIVLSELGYSTEI